MEDQFQSVPSPDMDHLESLNQSQVALEILPLESREAPAYVARRQRRQLLHGARQKAAAERAERHERDPEIAAGGGRMRGWRPAGVRR